MIYPKCFQKGFKVDGPTVLDLYLSQNLVQLYLKKGSYECLLSWQDEEENFTDP